MRCSDDDELMLSLSKCSCIVPIPVKVCMFCSYLMPVIVVMGVCTP